MNTHENNRLNSYKDILGVLTSTSELLEDIPVLKGYVAEFKELIYQIEQNGVITSKGTKPITAAKREARESLMQSATMIAAIVAAYAYSINDIDLERDVSFSYTDLKKSKENEFVSKAGIILDTAEAHAAALDAYLLTQESIEQFRKDLEAFVELIAYAGAVRSDVIAANKHIKELMRQAEELLDRKMDRMILAMKKDHEAFYYKYMQARKIKDLG